MNNFIKLRSELSQWQDEKLDCSIWCRDDDLVQVTSNLTNMHQVAEKYMITMLVSVIPMLAEKNLGEKTLGMDRFAFCQHGFRHVSHVTDGQSKSEFGANRDISDIRKDLLAGYELMHEIFGDRFYPVLVPPWNSINHNALPLIIELGYIGLSQYGFISDYALKIPRRINTHVDIINWQAKGNASIHETEYIDIKLAEVLSYRRKSISNLGEPTGILTHHRVMDGNNWKLFEELIITTKEYPCVKWLSPYKLFQ